MILYNKLAIQVQGNRASVKQLWVILYNIRDEWYGIFWMTHQFLPQNCFDQTGLQQRQAIKNPQLTWFVDDIALGGIAEW